ncbi:hypothetical protein PAEPH01_0958 [Pancytospora epiphaga]|nr:hypothetical protein PAEPH01_0958 [Pancytospora epiphaga]
MFIPMSIPGHICSEVNLPICKVLKLEPTRFASAEKEPLGVPINAPYTLILLLISILCAFRMINHVNSLFASIGRGEMRTFFTIYIVSNSLQFIILAFESYLPHFAASFLVILQTGLFSTLFFALFVAGFTIDRIYGILGMKSSTFMRIITVFFLVTITSFVSICCSVGNEFIILLVFAINTIFMSLYLIVQMSRLKQMNSDIWAYGILSIIFAVFILSNLHVVLGGQLVALLTERNLDNLFFTSLYTFMLVMMVHKYWLSTCDFELECLALKV